MQSRLAQYNPLRYRGYIYDAETGFYYLQSRYYDPAVGRFINSDSLVSTGQGVTGFNMFAYCNNNPVMYSDYTGNAAEGIAVGTIIAVILVSGVIGAVINAGICAATYYLTDEPTSQKGFWANVAGGAVSGFISAVISTVLCLRGYGLTNPIATGVISCGIGSFVGSVVETSILGIPIKEAHPKWFNDAAWGCVGGAIGGLMADPVVKAPVAAQLSKALKNPIKNTLTKVTEDLLEGFLDWCIEFFVEESAEEFKGG